MFELRTPTLRYRKVFGAVQLSYVAALCMTMAIPFVRVSVRLTVTHVNVVPKRSKQRSVDHEVYRLRRRTVP